MNNWTPSYETIKLTRQWFATNCDNCMVGAKSGDFHVNDLEGYIHQKYNEKHKLLNGDYDHTFTFLQRAYYIETGESVALLPK